jgi:hypothetical protein
MKKRILLVCKESYAWPMHYLAKILRTEGHELSAFFLMPHESILGAKDFVEFSERNTDLKIYTVKDVGLEYLRRVKNGELDLDWDYINKLESKYTHYKTLGTQQLASQLMSSYSHHRIYFPDVPAEQQLLFMQLYYQAVEKMLDEFRPDVIYDSDFSEHGRVILLEVAHTRKIPYITFESSRFKDYYLPSYSLSLDDARWISKFVEKRKTELRALPDRSQTR